MRDSSLYERIQYLERKLQELLTRYTAQQGTIERLQAENEQLRKAAHDMAYKKAKCSDNAGVSATSLEGAENWERKLDACIQEIDRHITSLEQQ